VVADDDVVVEDFRVLTNNTVATTDMTRSIDR